MHSGLMFVFAVLQEKIAHRPGPLELVQANILKLPPFDEGSTGSGDGKCPFTVSDCNSQESGRRNFQVRSMFLQRRKFRQRHIGLMIYYDLTRIFWSKLIGRAFRFACFELWCILLYFDCLSLISSERRSWRSERAC